MRAPARARAWVPGRAALGPACAPARAEWRTAARRVRRLRPSPKPGGPPGGDGCGGGVPPLGARRVGRAAHAQAGAAGRVVRSTATDRARAPTAHDAPAGRELPRRERRGALLEALDGEQTLQGDGDGEPARVRLQAAEGPREAVGAPQALAARRRA